MKRYVSLSTDANPQYASYAPLVGRLWRKLGWEPVFAVHREHWDTEFGKFILDQLSGYMTYPVDTYPPLSVGNTMRVVRLTVACLSDIPDDAQVMMSDVDMIPISRTFYDVPENWNLFVLRCDIQGALQAQLRPVTYRFAMCYTGARKSIWKELFNPVTNDVKATIDKIQQYGSVETSRILANGGAIHALAGDSTDVDELWMTAHILSSDRAQGIVTDTGERWDVYPIKKQGEIFLVPTIQPGGAPDRMMLLGEWRCVRNDKWDLKTAIDWHAPRPTASWGGNAVCKYWPEETEWISSYWANLSSLTQMRD